MNPSFEQALVEVWRQTLIADTKVIELGKERYPVRKTPRAASITGLGPARGTTGSLGGLRFRLQGKEADFVEQVRYFFLVGTFPVEARIG